MDKTHALLGLEELAKMHAVSRVFFTEHEKKHFTSPEYKMILRDYFINEVEDFVKQLAIG